MSLIKASIWLTLAELAFNISGIIVHSVLGRSLGPADYGRYGLVITFSTMVVVLIGRGVPIALSKYLSQVYQTQPEKISAIKKTATLVQIVLMGSITVIYFFLAPVFASLLNDPTLTPLFKLSTLIIPAFSAASFYVYYYNGLHKFGTSSALKFTRGLAKIILIIGAGMLLGVTGAIAAHAMVPFVVFLVAFWFDVKQTNTGARSIGARSIGARSIGARSIGARSIAPLRNFSPTKMISFAWPITAFLIFYEVMVSIDLYMIKAYFGSDELAGFYNASLTIGRLPHYGFYFLTVILLPKISEITANRDTKKTALLLSNASRFLFMLLLPCIALLAAFAPSAVRLFYGAKYTGSSSIDSGQILQVLILAMGLFSVFYTFSFALMGAGKNKSPMWLAIFGALLNTILNFLVIGHWGILGVAWTTVLTAVITALIITYLTHHKIAPFLKPISLLKYLLASLLLYYLAQFFPQGRFLFIAWSLLLTLLYFTILYLLKEVSLTDWKIIREQIGKRK